MKPLRFAPCAAVLLLGISSVLRAQAPAQASPEPASFERLDDLLSHDQIADAAGELAAIAVQAAPARPAVNPAQEEILRRAIESGRSHLAAAAPGSQERRASRQLLCLARAYFEEELPEPPSKTQEA
ncbi:MAG TPA: hypothetical protein VFR03_08010, partial [Thermoanaerobaculia bacterium]|nr:hypothetical protein [Thermoanaerobaculia bacterium]